MDGGGRSRESESRTQRVRASGVSLDREHLAPARAQHTRLVARRRATVDDAVRRARSERDGREAGGLVLQDERAAAYHLLLVQLAARG